MTDHRHGAGSGPGLPPALPDVQQDRSILERPHLLSLIVSASVMAPERAAIGGRERHDKTATG